MPDRREPTGGLQAVATACGIPCLYACCTLRCVFYAACCIRTAWVAVARRTLRAAAAGNCEPLTYCIISASVPTDARKSSAADMARYLPAEHTEPCLHQPRLRMHGCKECHSGCASKQRWVYLPGVVVGPLQASAHITKGRHRQGEARARLSRRGGAPARGQRCPRGPQCMQQAGWVASVGTAERPTDLVAERQLEVRLPAALPRDDGRLNQRLRHRPDGRH